jgi:Resolvase, N terminal domain
MSEQEKRQRKTAIGYTRTSSAANVGEGKDSVQRQRKAIQAYANRAGYRIVAWFDDPAVTGADAIDVRPGFAAAAYTSRKTSAPMTAPTAKPAKMTIGRIMAPP